MRIYYELAPNGIVIMRMLQHARDLDAIFLNEGDLAAIEKLVEQIRLSKDKTTPRHERLPQPSFSDAFPKANRRAEIQAAIAANQVEIVCGETGSGKTTQLPKICFELKHGIYGTIGCTQRRDRELA
jgi:HrpA-like RNA helicase